MNLSIEIEYCDNTKHVLSLAKYLDIWAEWHNFSACTVMSLSRRVAAPREELIGTI